MPRCITDPASIAWLLNIRGGDVPFTPFALGFALCTPTAAPNCSWTQPSCPPAITRVARQRGLGGGT